ncbi:hypothetical protein K525DRAFT_273164 [Schizophyllum commune Loenen D]|nr:hypothetical protein K525DRAFT_273164 [Schizophyllum commune Loenen D]
MAATFDKSRPTSPSQEWPGSITTPSTREDQSTSQEKPLSLPTTPSSVGLDISVSFPENFDTSAQPPESLSSLIPSQDEVQRVLDLVKQYLPAQISTSILDSDSHDAEVNDHVGSRTSHLPEASSTTVTHKRPPASRRSLSGFSTAANDGFVTSTPASSAAGTPDIDKATIILAFPSTIERRFTDLYASDRATDGHGTSSERATTGTSSLGRATTTADTTTSGGHATSTSAGHTGTTSSYGITGASHHADDGHSAPSDGPIPQTDGCSGRIPLYNVHGPAKKGTASTWLSSRERVDSPLASSLYADAGHSTLSDGSGGLNVHAGGYDPSRRPGFGPRTSSMMGVLSRSSSAFLSAEACVDSPGPGTLASPGPDSVDFPGQGTSMEGHVGHSSAGPSTPVAVSVDAQSFVPISTAQSSLPTSTAADAGHSSYGFGDCPTDYRHDDSLRDYASWRTLAGSPAAHHHECPVKQRLEAKRHREDALGTHPKELSAMQQDEDAEANARPKHAKDSEPSAQKVTASPTARVRFSDRLRGEAKILTGKLARKGGRVEEGRRIMGRA